jgi:hypothetical protein
VATAAAVTLAGALAASIGPRDETGPSTVGHSGAGQTVGQLVPQPFTGFGVHELRALQP